MWKKENELPQQPEPVAAPATPRNTPVESRSKTEGATIGPSISIKGDLTGGEDLIIQGQVEGRIDLKQNNVTVGKSGRVKADIHGRMITIEGEVEGNLFGEEQILLRQSGRSGETSLPLAYPWKMGPSSRAASTWNRRAQTKRPQDDTRQPAASED